MSEFCQETGKQVLDYAGCFGCVRTFFVIDSYFSLRNSSSEDSACLIIDISKPLLRSLLCIGTGIVFLSWVLNKIR